MNHRLFYLLALALNLAWLGLGDRLSLVQQMAVPFLTVGIAGTGVALRIRQLPRSARRRYAQGGLWVLLVYYLALLAVLLFFGGLFHMDRGWGGSLNLEPLHTIRSYLIYYRNTGSPVSLYNLVGNVVITVPLGMLLPLMFPILRRCWLALPLCALFALGVEWLQWYTRTGAADVDDSILNVSGALLGYLTVRLAQMIHARRHRAPNPSHREEQ